MRSPPATDETGGSGRDGRWAGPAPQSPPLGRCPRPCRYGQAPRHGQGRRGRQSSGGLCHPVRQPGAWPVQQPQHGGHRPDHEQVHRRGPRVDPDEDPETGHGESGYVGLKVLLGEIHPALQQDQSRHQPPDVSSQPGGPTAVGLPPGGATAVRLPPGGPTAVVACVLVEGRAVPTRDPNQKAAQPVIRPERACHPQGGQAQQG